MRTNDCLDQLTYAANIIMDTARTTSLRVAETARPLGIHDAEQDKDRMTALEARMRSLDSPSANPVEIIRMRNGIRVHVLVCSLVHGTVVLRQVAYAGVMGNSDPRQDAVKLYAQQLAENATAHR